MATRKKGRPPKPKRLLQTERLGFRVTKRDRRLIEKAARRRGQSVPEFLAALVRREVRRVEGEDLQSAIRLEVCEVTGEEFDRTSHYDEVLDEMSERTGESVVAFDAPGGMWMRLAADEMGVTSESAVCPRVWVDMYELAERLRREDESA